MYMDRSKSIARGSRKIIFLSLLISAALLLSYGQAFSLTINYLSSFQTNDGDPIRIAADKDGVLYVTCPRAGKILEFTQDGKLVGSIDGLKKPLSVAVDSSYRVYVGDFKEGSVTVMSPAGEALFSLGSGNGEFGMPGDIAIASNGLIYVTDSKNDVVKAYDQNGSLQFSFGGTGTAAGLMSFPTGIAADNANQEIYVVDHNNGRIEVFGFNGAYKRTFARFGSGQGRLTRPQGIQIANGYVYVADAYQSNISVFNTAGTFIQFVGEFGTDAGQLRVPMDVGIVGTTLFVANNDNARVEVFDIVDPQGLSTTPSSLTFTTTVGTNPTGQDIMVDSEIPNAAPPVQWSAAVNGSFINLGTTSGTTGAVPMPVTVNINTAGLAVGTYAGSVVFHSNGNNTDYPVTVTLNVLPPPQELIVSPPSVSLGNKDGDATSQSISVSTNWGSLSWSAGTNAAWLSLSATSGTTPGSITASLKQSVVKNLADGTYQGSITITSSDAVNSPVVIPVTLTVVQKKLLVSPDSLGLSFTNGVMTSGDLSLGANWGSLSWSAGTNAAWLSLSATSGTTPGSITASLKQSVVKNLADGTYQGSITITSSDAVNSPVVIPVTLTVVQQRLLVSAGDLELVHQINGDLASKSLSVQSNSGSLQWTASANANWLGLSASSGATPSSVTVSLTQNAGQLAEGTYSATITLTANAAVNSPVTVPVTLKVVLAGGIVVNVDNPDLDSVSFAISGTAVDGTEVNYAGSGKSWSADNVKPGTYNLKFDYIKGYRRPASTLFEVQSGRTVTLNARYMPLPLANMIVAAKGPGSRNDAAVRVLDLDGGLINEFRTLDSRYGANVAVGDVDGDGESEIIVAPGPGYGNEARIKVFRSDGSVVAETAPIRRSFYGASIAAGDINGDGKAEIAMSFHNGYRNITVYALEGGALVEKTRISLGGNYFIDYPANIAFGDLRGDGWLEMLVAADGKISVYEFDQGLTSASLVSRDRLARNSNNYRKMLTVSAGDLNGDGVDEVLVGLVDDRTSTIQVLNGDLTDYGLTIPAFARDKSAPGLSAMDSDGDSEADILAGAGAEPENDAIVRLLDSGGAVSKEIRAFDRTGYGVNAAFGVKK